LIIFLLFAIDMASHPVKLWGKHCNNFHQVSGELFHVCLRGALGSQYQVADEDFTLQRVGDRYVYLAPLVHRSFFTWYSTGKSPGYVAVDALNPDEPAKVVVGKDFKYVPSAYFDKNLKRHLRDNGFLFNGLEDYSFELDDENNPFFVVTTYHASLGWGGKIVDGVVVVHPVDGKIQKYATAAVPAWVDRV